MRGGFDSGLYRTFSFVPIFGGFLTASPMEILWYASAMTVRQIRDVKYCNQASVSSTLIFASPFFHYRQDSEIPISKSLIENIIHSDHATPTHRRQQLRNANPSPSRASLATLSESIQRLFLALVPFPLPSPDPIIFVLARRVETLVGAGTRRRIVAIAAAAALGPRVRARCVVLIPAHRTTGVSEHGGVRFHGGGECRKRL